METNTQVAIIHNSIEIFKTAPEVLKANQDRTNKAVAVGNNILAAWKEAWNIEDENEKLAALLAVDERSNNYLVNCKKVLSEEKEARAAITQMMDEFKKMFTSADNDIDVTKQGTAPMAVQTNRNEYSKFSFQVAERKRKEAELIAAKAKEAIDIKSNIELNLNAQFSDHLLRKKQSLTQNFNSLSLDDFEERSNKLKALKPEPKFIPQALCTFNIKYHSDTELAEMVDSILSDKMGDMNSTYIAEMSLLIDELIDKLPSKKAELEEQKRLAEEAAEAARRAKEAEEQRQAAIAKANAKEKERLEKEAAEQRKKEEEEQAELKRKQDAAAAEQKKREEEEAERLRAEAEEAKAKADQETEIKAQGEQTMVMFETEAATADIQVAEARQGYDIIVVHQAGWVQIFQLWFEQEGKNLPIDKIGNTKLDQMKSWAEKQAHKTGTKIESKFLKYEETFKAVNRKSSSK